MDQLFPSTTHPPPTAVSVAPLTQTGKKSGELYRRREDVETEISESLTSDPAAWIIAKQKSETLVHLLRWIRPRNDLNLTGKVVHELGRRIAQIARDVTSGLSKSEAEDFAADVAARLNCLIFAVTPNRQSEFLEVSFRLAVKRHALKEREKIDERKSHVITEASISTGDEDAVGIISGTPDDQPHSEEVLIAIEQKELNSERAQRALAAITNPKHREAFILHEIEKWPIPTLSTYLKMSGRQIQNWIKTARKQMRTALGDAT